MQPSWSPSQTKRELINRFQNNQFTSLSMLPTSTSPQPQTSSKSSSQKLFNPKSPDQLLANYQCGVLSPSTPPLSRRRRHSKLHLRIASELSVDHSESSNFSESKSTDLVNQSTNTNTKILKERYRIVILGSSAVGKTAIVEQFLYGSFPDTHCATVEELHKGEYEIPGGGCIPLEILDTSGSFEFPAMRRLAISTGDAFALVYSIDNQASFEEMKNIREMIKEVKGGGGTNPMPPIVVVGNKNDLDETNRQVKMELAECECIDWEHGFVECSAKNNKNIINIFSCMLIQARLNGTLNVSQLSSSKHGSKGSHWSDMSRLHQRRRSSFSELFHRSSTSNNRSTDARGRQASGHSSSFSKNSCTPS